MPSLQAGKAPGQSYSVYLLDICEFQRCPNRCVIGAAYSHAMAELEVRPIGRQELEEVLPLIAGYQQFYGAQPDDARNRAFFSRFLHPSDEGLLLGAWVDGRIAGFATLYWFHSSTKAAD